MDIEDIELGTVDVPDDVIEHDDEDADIDATEVDTSHLPDDGDGVDISAPLNPVHCPVCDEPFDDDRGMRIHFGQMHKGEELDDDGDLVNDDSDDEDTEAGTEVLQDDDGPDAVTTPDNDDGESIESRFDKREESKKTVEDKWDDAREKYLEAGTNGHDTRRRDALAYAIEALEKETEYMSVRERSELGDHDLRVWSDKHGWVDTAHGVIAERMEAELGTDAGDTTAEKAAAHLAKRNKVDEDELNAQDRDGTFVSFQNGLLKLESVEFDAETGTIDPHSVELIEETPEHRMTRRLPMQWDPELADIELAENWINSLTGGDETDARTLWEGGGHALLPRYDPQGFIVVIAEGSNGKTTLFNVLHAAFGNENTTAIPLDKITGSKFSSYRMVDRLANLHADISGAQLTDVSALKAATGDDRMEVEKKGKDPWDARNRATQIMAANDAPAIVEDNKAIKRRLMPVILDVDFVRDADPDDPTEVEKDDDIEDELTSDAGLAALAVKFVEAARRLQEVGEFSAAQEYSGDERLEMYKRHADPSADFRRTCLVRDPNGAGIAIDDIKACYDAYAADQDHPAKMKSTLMKMLKKMKTTVMRRSDPRSWTDDDDRTGVVKGMAFTDAAKEHWLPDDAHWHKYGGRPTDDDTPAPKAEYTPVQMLEAGTGRHDGTIRVEVASRADTPSYGWDDQGVLKDGTDSIRFKIESGGTLETGATYEMSKFIVGKFESARVIHIVPGMTEFECVETSPADTRDAALTENVNDGEGSEDEVSQEERVKTLKDVVDDVAAEHDDGAPIDEIREAAEELGISTDKFQHEFDKLQQKGAVYEPKSGRWRAT
jgi:putative DNA primase/helicase